MRLRSGVGGEIVVTTSNTPVSFEWYLDLIAIDEGVGSLTFPFHPEITQHPRSGYTTRSQTSPVQVDWSQDPLGYGAAATPATKALEDIVKAKRSMQPLPAWGTGHLATYMDFGKSEDRTKATGARKHSNDVGDC